MEKRSKADIVRELKRRGYTVTLTADQSYLVEKKNWWGNFSYDAGAGIDNSHIKWGRTLLLGLFSYGFLTVIGGLWWLYQKGKMREEVLSLKLE